MDVDATLAFIEELKAVDFDLKKFNAYVYLDGRRQITGQVPMGDEERAKVEIAGYVQSGYMFGAEPFVIYEFKRKDAE